MQTYHLSFLAQQDLRNIWVYTEENWSVQQAEDYITDIKEGLDHISHFQNLAQKYQIQKGEEYLNYFINSHIVLFRIKSDVLYITRILNQRKSIELHL